MEHLRGLSLVQALVLIQVVGTIQFLTAMALRVTVFLLAVGWGLRSALEPTFGS